MASNVMRLFDFARSINAGLRASAAVGRGFRARDRGDMRSALIHAQVGLALLRKPYVRRSGPVEGTTLVSLTILAEDVATPLSEPGASLDDLSDSISFLTRLAGEKQPKLCSSIPYLEYRLAAASSPPAA